MVPKLLRLPADFAYSADVFSLDNLYDEEKEQFLGAAISKSSFSLKAIERRDNTLLIKNTFNVRRMDGTDIFSAERVYAVDAISGAHVPRSGDRDRTGYLFAPRRLGLFRAGVVSFQ